MDNLKKQLSQVKLNYLWAAVVVFMLLWRIPYYGKTVLDDPYITFQYAQNLVQHGQFVYNLNEWVLATTTPTYALLMSLAASLQIPLPLAATVLNLILEAALLYVIGKILQQFTIKEHYQFVLVYLLVGALVVTNRAMSIASNSGMETILFTLLNMLALYSVMRQRYTQGTVWGSLATLTRPDGIFVLVVLGLDVIVRQRRLPFKEVLLSVAIGLPWVVIATLTYGSFIPHSITAKSAIEHIWFTGFFAKLSVVFYEPLRMFGIFLLLPLGVGIWHIIRDYRHRASLLLFGAFHLLYLMLPSNLGFEWYFAPLYVTLNIIAGIGLIWLLNAKHLQRGIAVFCAGGLVLGIGYSSIGNYLSVARIDSIWRDGMRQIARDLGEVANEGDIIQTTNIGIIRYDSGVPVLDPLGLASPDVVPIIRDAQSLQELRYTVAEAFTPTYIVSFNYDDYPNYEEWRVYETVDIPLVVYRYLGEEHSE